MNIVSFLDLFTANNVVLLVLLTAIYAFVLVSKWVIYTKMEEPGVFAVIPFVNDYILFKKCWTTELVLLCWVSTLYINLVSPKSIGSIAEFVLYVAFGTISIAMELWKSKKLSDAFGQSLSFSIGMLFLPFIFYPILAFSNDKQYIGNKPYSHCRV